MGGNVIDSVSGRSTSNNSSRGSNSGVTIKTARVESVIMDDTHEAWEKLGGWDSLGTIFWADPKSVISMMPLEGLAAGVLDYARPLDTGKKQYPVKGEIILLFSGILDKNTMGARDKKEVPLFYYTSIVNLWNQPHHNAFPQTLTVDSDQTGQTNISGYKQAESGIVIRTPNAGQNTTIPYGDYFREKFHIKPLLPYEGDTIFEGRFGQSIRFGSTTPYDGKSELPQPNINHWSINSYNKLSTDKTVTGSVGDPILIIRNGIKKQKNSHIPSVESIKDDFSSIYMTSNQVLADFGVAGSKTASPNTVENGDDGDGNTQTDFQSYLQNLREDGTTLKVPDFTIDSDIKKMLDLKLQDNKLGNYVNDSPYLIHANDMDLVAVQDNTYIANPITIPVILPAPTTETTETGYNDDDELSFYDELTENTSMTDDDFEVFYDTWGATTRNAMDISTNLSEINSAGQNEGFSPLDAATYESSLALDWLNQFNQNSSGYETDFDFFKRQYDTDGKGQLLKRLLNWYGDLTYYSYPPEGFESVRMNDISTNWTSLENAGNIENYFYSMVYYGLYDGKTYVPEDAIPGSNIFNTGVSINQRPIIPDAILDGEKFPIPTYVILPNKNNSTRINLYKPRNLPVGDLNPVYHPYFGRKKTSNPPENLIIHASGGPITDTAIDIVMAQLYSKAGIQYNNGNPAYHYLIEFDGKFCKVLDDDQTGWAAQGMNHSTIHICWVGGKTWSGTHRPTHAQSYTLNKIILYYLKRYPNIRILGHNQVLPRPEETMTAITERVLYSKDCPGFYVPSYLEELGLMPEAQWAGTSLVKPSNIGSELSFDTKGSAYGISDEDLLEKYKIRGRAVAKGTAGNTD